LCEIDFFIFIQGDPSSDRVGPDTTSNNSGEAEVAPLDERKTKVCD